MISIGFGQPRDLVGAWVKPSSSCDTAHQVIYRSGNQLRTGCQMKMDARIVTRAVLGVRCCETCMLNAIGRTRHAAKKNHR